MIKKDQINIELFRREYFKGKLRRKNLTEKPLELFKCWLNEAYNANISDPNAMSIATVDDKGQPYQRIVLLKKYNRNGLNFYTNLFSRKIEHILNNNRVSLLFPWNEIDRQVCFIGNAKKISFNKSAKYFYNRPRDSQIATLVSYQSKKINSRRVLKDRFLELEEKFKNNKIPLPNFWSGWRVEFTSVEFWQGREKRLHDRFLYKLKNNKWKIYRLSP